MEKIKRYLTYPFLSILWVYKVLVSPFLGTRCRFHPSCSNYADEAIRAHGLIKGSLLAVLRLLRCHPFCSGGYDPVPLKPYKKLAILWSKLIKKSPRIIFTQKYK